MSIRGKIQYTFIGVTIGLVLTTAVLSIVLIRARLVDTLGKNLTVTARTVAPFIDGDLHELITATEDGNGPEFQELKALLRKSQISLGMPREQMYTIRSIPGDTERMEFVVMTHPRSFVGDRLARNEVMDRTLASGEAHATRIYSTVQGQWISAFAPIKTADGRVVGLLEVDESYSDFQAQFLRESYPIFIGALALPLVLVVVAIVLAGRISAPLRIIRDRMNELHAGRGDLTRRIDMQGKDEIATTAGYIDDFNGQVAGVIRGVKSFSGEVEKDAGDLRKIADSLQESGRQETGLIQATTAANEELAASFEQVVGVVANQKQLVNQVVPNIDRLLRFILQVRDNAQAVNTGLKEAAEKIHEGKSEITAMSGATLEIQRSSEQIESIVAIIVDISDRIALLSLNASIEAARAGEYGRGFAVVAEEVARLSDSTARQIKDITDIIQRNRQETRGVVDRTARAEELYDELVRLVEHSVESSARNIEAAEDQRDPAQRGRQRLEELTALSDEISRAINEQSRSSGEVARSMISLGELSEANGFLTEKVYQRVVDLEKQVAKLDETLSQLTV